MGRATTEVVQGGLRRGVTPLVLEVEPVPGVPPGERSLEVTVHALTPTLRTPAGTVSASAAACRASMLRGERG